MSGGCEGTRAGASASLHIVIVNWNTGDRLGACLTSIVTSRHVHVGRVTVIDNASCDGSATGYGDLPLPLEVIRNAGNVGFARACNQGAAGSSADYLLFLNPDTHVLPDTLARVIGFMESTDAADFGICGVQVRDDRGLPTISCSRFPTLRIFFGKMTKLDRLLPQLFPHHHMTQTELRQSGRVEQVIGAFFLVRRELFDRLGGFDERYFVYFEEVDFALRARTAGADSYFLAEATVFHSGQVSSGANPGMRLYHSLRSRLLYAYRHWRRPHAHALAALTFVVEFPARLAHALVIHQPSEVRGTLCGYRRLLTELPALLSADQTRAGQGVDRDH